MPWSPSASTLDASTGPVVGAMLGLGPAATGGAPWAGPGCAPAADSGSGYGWAPWPGPGAAADGGAEASGTGKGYMAASM